MWYHGSQSIKGGMSLQDCLVPVCVWGGVIKLKLLQCVLLHRGKAEMVVEIGTVSAVLVQ